MLGKDHDLLLKKVLKVFSRLSVFSLYNSESSPKILQFFSQQQSPDCLT